VEEELDVPFRTGDRRGRRGYRRQSYLTGGGGHFVTTRAWIAVSRITPLRISLRPASNCGLTSATTSPSLT
jgi:hypothetical protein